VGFPKIKRWPMSSIISFLNQKGGVGKSNLSINVAACLALLPDTKVLLIDADKQGTASDWASLREETSFQVVKMARENMARDALRLAQILTSQ
jgi:chromosome partitioning protein